MKRKRPEGESWYQFVDAWHSTDHDGKVFLADKWGVGYDTAKHWISDTGSARKEVKKEYNLTKEVPPFSAEPLEINTGRDMVTFAVIGDTHNPHQDNKTVELINKFLTDIQPDYLVYNGDINDFYQVSVFDKDPNRLGRLQDDLDVTTAMFDEHSRLLPDTKKIFVEGTHEHRWFKYLRQNAPALAHLRSTSISELYRLSEFDMTYVPFEQGILINNSFLILHGDVVSKHSSYTAKRQHESNGGNGMCNHTHRGGSYYLRDRFGTWGWWENFCLCSLNPDWISFPNWCQGFSLVHFKEERFWVEQVPIVGHAFIYGGELYE